jgi:hypothetical protein
MPPTRMRVSTRAVGWHASPPPREANEGNGEQLDDDRGDRPGDHRRHAVVRRQDVVPADMLAQPGHPQPRDGHDPAGRQHVQRFREDTEMGMAVGHEGADCLVLNSRYTGLSRL